MRVRTPLLAAAVCAALMGTGTLASAQITIGVSVHIAPPVIPVYTQPVMPASGYLWVPGYWAWADDGAYYYWVPGTWVLPPEPGLLWTPGYWGWTDDVYVWHEGYWGTHVGFYGGVDYGFGYGPRGYDGGYWNHGQFYYNTAVTRLRPGVRLPHTYNHPIAGGGAPGHASFNGGRGGVQVHATAEQLSAGREHHVEPIGAQRDLVTSASHDQQMRANFNHGHPGVAAAPRADTFARSRGEAARAPQPSGAEPRGEPPAARGSTGERGPAGERGPTVEHGPVAEHSPATEHGAARAHEPRAQGNSHPTPTFAPREHVPAAPRAEPHATPQANNHPAAPHPAARGGDAGDKGGDRRDQHPPQR